MKNIIIDGVSYNLIPIIDQETKRVEKEFPKIISFRRTDTSEYIINLTGRDNYNGWSLDGMLHTGECVDSGDIEIYQVAVSESEVFTLGEKIYAPGTSYKGVLNEFKVIGGNEFKIGIGIGDYADIYIDMCSIKKYKEPILITDDNVEIFEGDEYWHIYYTTLPRGPWKLIKEKCSKFPFSVITHTLATFKSEELAKKYFDENKPIYSKKQVKEALECAVHEYIKYVNSTSWERTFKQKLNL